MNAPSKELETFHKPEYVSQVMFTSDELISFYPVTEQPDFNTMVIEYHPDKLCVESKSLKLYLWTFRDERILGEGLVGTIAHNVFEKLQPFYYKVALYQKVRGGLQMTTITKIKREGSDQQ